MVESLADIPFVGRLKETEQLEAAFAKSMHVVISGAGGCGKSELLNQLKLRLQFYICNKTSRIDLACRELADNLEIPVPKSSVKSSKPLIIAELKRRGKPVAFDNFDEATASVVDLIEQLLDYIPIWFVTRRSAAQGIGIIGSRLREFACLEVPPMKKKDMRILVVEAVKRGIVPTSCLNRFDQLYFKSQGNPSALRVLLHEVLSKSA